ncbi:MAG: UDP-N-acetylenolpyruvoylglucosamine reductase [Spirochaeta sp. LUC14_002_19_P3]|nr:MAG: UDP-N-acetylenolpyruvoylglucosamine reductase [Spirochaeta sp. LUC14_002_19_P3]
MLCGYPLWHRCTLQIGGPADYYCIPENEQDLKILLTSGAASGIPFLTLGSGSNILLADKGVRGMVIDTRNFTDSRMEGHTLILGAGLEASAAAWTSASSGLQGLEFLFGMPGTIGGALWMNARCYGAEIADIFEWADIINPNGTVQRLPFNAAQWSYKRSPFQNSDAVILRGAFRTTAGNPAQLRQTMLHHYQNRLSKGHYSAPCAGSAFKNNRDFGSPSGKIIEDCGLKGLQIGRAAISHQHANIFINTGGASASDFLQLLNTTADKVEQNTGFRLEPEIVLAGEWQTTDQRAGK